jgi:IS5 family transposase
MKEKINPQISLFEFYAEHEMAQQLKSISTFLDNHSAIVDLAAQDLCGNTKSDSGRKGLTADSILRAALLKQMMGLSYEELSFYLVDSISYRSFTRLSCDEISSSGLQANIVKITAPTWERINHILLGSAAKQKIEKGRTVRIDSTVTETNIHAPTDSSLLWDCIRTMVRLLSQLKNAVAQEKLYFCDHSRSAKRLAFQIQYARGAKNKKYYGKLLKLAESTKNYLLNAMEANPSSFGALLLEQTSSIIDLTNKVLSQTRRRVIHNEKVPVADKVCSIFEPHSDIIVKGSRDVQFGHKLNITTGKSGLVLDVVIEQGNPADTAQLCPMIARQKTIYGQVPRQAAADGGYASQDNLKQAKDMGVKDVSFNKKKGLKVEDMVKSSWVYKRLTKFRAGIEGNISCLKRRYGLGRCTWRGKEKFNAFVWASTVAYNLMLLARLNIAT